MKNAIKLFGIIALVAVIGFSMTACGGDDDDGGGGGGGGKTPTTADLVGTWEYSNAIGDFSSFTFSGTNSVKFGGYWGGFSGTETGTYTLNEAAGTITFSDNVATLMGENKPYSISLSGTTLKIDGISYIKQD